MRQGVLERPPSPPILSQRLT